MFFEKLFLDMVNVHDRLSLNEAAPWEGRKIKNGVMLSYRKSKTSYASVHIESSSLEWLFHFIHNSTTTNEACSALLCFLGLLFLGLSFPNTCILKMCHFDIRIIQYHKDFGFTCGFSVTDVWLMKTHNTYLGLCQELSIWCWLFCLLVSALAVFQSHPSCCMFTPLLTYSN